MNTENIYDRKSFSVGTVIVKAGEQAFNAYLIQSGVAAVYKGGTEDLKEVGQLNAGDIIGDMAIIRKSKHLLTVKAKEPLIAVVIPPGHIEKCIRDADPLMKTLLQGMIRRIDRMNKSI